MQKEIIVSLHKKFEDYVHVQDEVEFWYSRELQELLGYDKWLNFENVINKAKIACENAKQPINDHFADVGKMADLGLGTKREIVDIMLTRWIKNYPKLRRS